MSQPVFAPPDVDYVFNRPEDCGVLFKDMMEKYVPLPNSEQAQVISGLAEPGFSAVYRNKFTNQLKKVLAPGLDTYFRMWENAVSNFPDSKALAWRPYDYKTGTSAPEYEASTFREVDEKVKAFGAGLLHVLQHSPFQIAGCESHEKINSHAKNHRVYSEHDVSFVATFFLGNRAEWVIADLACVSYAITNTVLYDTLGKNTSQYILKLTESPVVVAAYSHLEQLISLKKEHSEDLALLITLVSMDPLNCESEAAGREMVRKAREVNIELFDMEQVVGVGRLFPQETLPPNPESLYTISFTSGTTGAAPKGVMLTHITAALGITFMATNGPGIADDVELIFLPLAHIYERQSLAKTLLKGGMCGFPQLNGSPLTLIDDLKALKPKHICNVPRVYTKLEAAIKNATIQLDLAIKRSLFAKVVDTKDKLQSLNESVRNGHWFYDNFVLPKVRKQVGFDNMIFCGTGLAPISPLTVKFIKAALNVGMGQGYGLTELFAGFCISQLYEKNPGSCGATGITTDVRVRDLPEMGYRINDPRGPSGELLIRGPQTFTAYYKNREETEKSIKDGWFYTGDVARIDPYTGKLYIIDRVKNFFKLAQGEYVTPEKVENAYLSSNLLLTQAFVHGDSLRNHLVAVLGVDRAGITDFLAYECKEPKVDLQLEEAILNKINKTENRIRLLKKLNSMVSGLSGFELIHNVYVEFEPLKLEREVITPTVKIRRPMAAKFFAEQIKNMYDEPSLISKSKI